MELLARTVLETPLEHIFEAFADNVKYSVMYEDGVVVNEHKQAIVFNRFCWDLLKLRPGTPIYSKCSVIEIIGDGYFNFNTHIKCLEVIFNHICEYNGITRYSHKEDLLKKCYVIVNDIFNNIIHRVSGHVATIDAVDFVRMIKDKQVEEIQSKLVALPESVDATHRAIRNFVKESDVKNRFVEAYRSKSINENQANQCVGPRGFVTGLDRTVYRMPIMNGFIKGMGTLYEMLTESLTAAKSLNASDTHIKTSEYASRRIQLLTMVVTSVDVNDCGSNDLMEVFVTEKYLPNLAGKWYKVFDTDELKCIKGNEKDLINRVIKIRTAFKCRAPNPHSICTKCLGALSENFKENSNLGYTMTAYLMEKLTQAILSTKHLTHSVKKSAIKLEGQAEKYFYSTDSNDIYFNSDLNLEHLYLLMPANKLSKLVDVLSLNHTNVALNKVGELEIVGIRNDGHTPPFIESVNIAYKDRFSTITRSLLKYIKSIDIQSDAKGNFVVPMKDFDKTQPVFSNQLKETNIISFVNKIASMIEGTKNTKLSLEEHFFQFVDTVFDQFNCNISVLETIIYATTSFNSMNGNYRLARNTPHAKCENRSLLFRNRSISQLLVFESQQTELLKHSMNVFSNNFRMDHPLDVLFAPQDIVPK